MKLLILVPIFSLVFDQAQAAMDRQCTWGELSWNGSTSQPAIARFQMPAISDWSFVSPERMDMTVETWPSEYGRHNAIEELSGFCDLKSEQFQFEGPHGMVEGRCYVYMYYEPGSQAGLMFEAVEPGRYSWQFLHLHCNGPW